MRSTGQIEEGPSCLSVAAEDGGRVSWRFKPLDYAWPFVLVTAPVDRRLAKTATQNHPGTLIVGAKVIGDARIDLVEARLDDGDWTVMMPVPGAVALWQVSLPASGGQVGVRARDVRWREDIDMVEPVGGSWALPERVADGSDRNRVDTWQEKGIAGGQLGPNRNGRKW